MDRKEVGRKREGELVAMIKKVDQKQLGTAYHTWLQSLFHFSYANYHQPSKKFGVLRVINDDILHAGSGHDLHKHKEVEILTYVLEGSLTHTPRQYEMKMLGRGDFYYMCAGHEIEHGEFNWGDTPVRMIQVWMVPKQKSLTPSVQYGSWNPEMKKNKWHLIASSTDDTLINIHQDVRVWLIQLESNQTAPFEVTKGHQAYLIQLEGKSRINEEQMKARDGLEIYEDFIEIQASEESHFMLIEMALS